MKGNGNGWSTLFQKLYFMFIPSSGKRTIYINKHANKFKHIGRGIFWQPRTFPTDPELISIGDNVMIGAGTVILPNVRIGSNVVIGAGSIVCKDIPDNVVAAGVPCRVVGDFDKLVEKYKSVRKLPTEELWKEFYMIKNM